METTEILVAFEKIIFKADGYVVLSLSTNDDIPTDARQNTKFPKSRNFAFTGIYNDIADFSSTLKKKYSYKVTGTWKKSKNLKYSALQFEISNLERVINDTRDEIVDFLLNLNGIGKKTAEAIYNKFGSNSIEVINNYPEKLLDVRGISSNKIEKIVEDLKRANAYKRISDYFNNFSLSQRKIKKIYEAFGEMSISFVEENPYCLSQVSGLNFQDIDSIAIDLKKDLTTIERLSQGINYCAYLLSLSNGHLCLDKNKIICNTVNLLNKNSNNKPKLDFNIVEAVFNELEEDGIFISQKTNNGNYIYRKKDFIFESMTAKKIVDFMHNPNYLRFDSEFLKKEIANAESEFNIKLSDKQKLAIRTSLNSPFSVITGGPGTGKTTILKFILKIFNSSQTHNVMLAAPTGRAARRMAESTGYMGASTIHSLLGLVDDSDDESTLPELNCDLIIIDEASMIDMSLMYKLISAIPFNCKVILLGDSDQLPSVGPGNVLREVIKSNVIPYTTLDVIYRQNDTSKIVVNSDKLRRGFTDYSYDNNFQLISETNTEDVTTKIVELYKREISRPDCNIDNVQVLTPFRTPAKPVSTFLLNQRLQALVNPPSPTKPEVKVNKVLFRLGDKVIQQKNNEEVKNGDIGYIRSIKFDKGEANVTIEFLDSRYIEYTRSDIEEYSVNLAYAITIHKSQGSEYKTVIMPIISQHTGMLNKNLIYTAWTRAKEKVLMVGDESVLKKSSKICNIDNRNTFLAGRLKARENQYLKRNFKKVS